MLLVGASIGWIVASLAWWLWGPDTLRIRAIGFAFAIIWAAVALSVVSLEPRMFVSESTWRHGSHLRHVRVLIEVGIPLALAPWCLAVAVRFALSALPRGLAGAP